MGDQEQQPNRLELVGSSAFLFDATQLEVLEHYLLGKEFVLSQKDREIAEKNTAIAEKDRQIYELFRLVSEAKDEQLATKEVIIKNLSGRVSSLNEELSLLKQWQSSGAGRENSGPGRGGGRGGGKGGAPNTGLNSVKGPLNTSSTSASGSLTGKGSFVNNGSTVKK